MQLSEQTKKLLQNYVGINNGIVIQASQSGKPSVIRTTDHKMTMYSTALVPEQFPNTVILYDLNAFLNVVAGMDDPNVEFNDNHLLISEGNSSVKMVYADPRTVIHRDKDWNWAPENVKVQFELKQDVLSKILKMADVLGLKNLKITNKAGKLVVQALDASTPSSNTYDVEIGNAPEGMEDYFIKREFMKMIPGDYLVEINGQAAQFVSLNHDNLKYLLALEIVND